MNRTMLSLEEIVLLNDCARVLRDEADKDYIAARSLLCLDLPGQFLWAALQAVEKYLKSIFLFNEKPARAGHDVLNLLDELMKTVDDISFDITHWPRTFARTLQEYGDNRYLTMPRVMLADCLFLLDRTVWELRRYCQYIRGGSIGGNGHDTEQCFRQALLQIKASRKKPHKYRISGGYLERVLAASAKDPRRKQLVYKNFLFGAKKKNRVNYRNSYSLTMPPHFNDPQSFDFLCKYLYFHRQYIADFKKAHNLP